MKKTVCVLFALFVAGAVSARETTPWPDSFLAFYKKFRTAVIAQSYTDITEMTCFPFKAFDLTETLDTVPYKKKLRLIEKGVFTKHQLAKYFLTQTGDITSDTPVIENGVTARLVYLYENNAQLIAENDDPRSLKKLQPNSSGYEAKSGIAFVSGMEFIKKENSWCWSYASYMRDGTQKW